MSKASEMGKVSAVGGMHIFLGKMCATVMQAVGTIIVGMLILPEDYGLYAIAFVPATALLLFQDWGVGSAMARFCAKSRAENNASNLRRTIKVGLTFEVITAVLLTAVSLGLASFFASTVMAKPEATFVITIASAYIFSLAISNAVQNIFVGFEQMKLYTIVLVCQAVIQAALMPLLVFLGYGAVGATVGYAIAIASGAVLGVLLLYFTTYRKIDKTPSSAPQGASSQMLKELLKYGVPLGIAGILVGAVAPFYSFLTATYCTAIMLGNNKIATNFSVLLNFFVLPITTVLFPAFSKIDPAKEKALLKTVFTSSVKYTALLITPVTIGLMVLSGPLIQTLYADKWPSAPLFLSLSLIGELFFIIGNLSVGTLLSGVGETKLLLKLNVLSLALGIPIAFLLIPPYGIVGSIIGSTISALPSAFVGVFIVWKRYGVIADLVVSGKILVASLAAGGAAYLIFGLFSFAYWLQLASGLLTFVVVYLVVVPLIGAVNQSDLASLRGMFANQGVVSKVLNIPLGVMEKILGLKQTNRKVETNPT
jgi:O-antigen/teichoic acid export membrane protein